VDHARVVKIMRNADHLPLVKDYLLAVQKSNLAAVNEAVNQLLIEEEVSTLILLGGVEGGGGGSQTTCVFIAGTRYLELWKSSHGG